MHRRFATILLLVAFCAPQLRVASDPCVSTAPDGCTGGGEHGNDAHHSDEASWSNAEHQTTTSSAHACCGCPCHTHAVAWRAERRTPMPPVVSRAVPAPSQARGGHCSPPYRPPRHSS